MNGTGEAGISQAGAETGRPSAFGADQDREREAARNLALQIASAIDEGKGFHVVVLDVHQMTLIADYFVIGSGANQRHVKALADRLTDGPGFDRHPNHVEGYAAGRWVLLDYGDVVAHIFQDDERSFYGLERLWGDAPKLQGTNAR